ncbi:MAG: tail fiber domain-containing protein [Dysgonamonadaceae bacterium]|jgi:hypothetical protein|nr:tail fiber domain-containing protein [Dysgonamonadaceae bacterium]
MKIIMKTIVIFFIALFFSASFAFSQLKVSSAGNVGIAVTGTQVSPLSVGTTGDAAYKSAIDGNIISLRVFRSGTNTHASHWGTAVSASNTVTSTPGDMGVEGVLVKPSPTSSGRAIGVTGTASNATSGYNYGVIGNVAGTNNGTGVLGIAQQDGGLGVYIDGRYAGYFQGNVKVTGTINGVTVGSSDIRYKQNVADIEKENILDKIVKLNPVSYNFKQVYLEPESDTTTLKRGLFDEKSQMFQKKHFGLIAQDLQQIYPDLVYEEDNGYLSINYVELVPLLIQSVKELKAEVDRLAETLALRSASATDALSGDLQQAVLYQNAPNPFSEQTEIKFQLPDNVLNAAVYIFNMQGALIKQIPVGNKQTSVVIYGSELQVGMYLYSLIVNGKEVDTKRMILSK